MPIPLITFLAGAALGAATGYLMRDRISEGLQRARTDKENGQGAGPAPEEGEPAPAAEPMEAATEAGEEKPARPRRRATAKKRAPARKKAKASAEPPPES
jgi:hypothetical protein